MLTIRELQFPISSKKICHNLKMDGVHCPQGTPVLVCEKGKDESNHNILQWEKGQAFVFFFVHSCTDIKGLIKIRLGAVLICKEEDGK